MAASRIKDAHGELGRSRDLVFAAVQNFDGQPDARGVDNGFGERPG